jgi:hypothetical protein
MAVKARFTCAFGDPRICRQLDRDKWAARARIKLCDAESPKKRKNRSNSRAKHSCRCVKFIGNVHHVRESHHFGKCHRPAQRCFRFADAFSSREMDGDDPRNQSRAARCGENARCWLNDIQLDAFESQNESAEVRVLGKVADVLVHVGGVDFERLSRSVRRAKRDIVEHALHHRLQPPRTDILDA